MKLQQQRRRCGAVTYHVKVPIECAVTEAELSALMNQEIDSTEMLPKRAAQKLFIDILQEQDKNHIDVRITGVEEQERRP
jgi:hypothetical protein